MKEILLGWKVTRYYKGAVEVADDFNPDDYDEGELLGSITDDDYDTYEVDAEVVGIDGDTADAPNDPTALGDVIFGR